MIEYSIPATKKCTKCGEIKPATTEFFCRRKINKDGLYSWCRVCSNASGREWKAANDERHRASRRAWYAANKERSLATARAYAQTHKERIAAFAKEYRETHRVMRRAEKHRRRARKLNATGDHTDADIKAQYERQHGKCYYCGEEVGDNFHTDHIVPLGRGGTNDPDNIVVACPTCNRAKANKLPHEWAKGGRLI